MPRDADLLPFQIDHVIARKHGGTDASDNLALACFACNNHKGPNIAGLDPETGLVVRLFHPLRDSWFEHFVLDGATILGRTPVGRATIDVLAFNLDYRVALRQTLLDTGHYPVRAKVES